MKPARNTTLAELSAVAMGALVVLSTGVASAEQNTDSKTTSSPSAPNCLQGDLTAIPQVSGVSTGARSSATEIAEVPRGRAFELAGEGFPCDSERMSMFVGGVELAAPIFVTADGTKATFPLRPKSAAASDETQLIPLGNQLLSLKVWPTAKGKVGAPISLSVGQISVRRATPFVTLLNPLEPAVAQNSRWEATIGGKGFSSVSAENRLFLDDKELSVTWADPKHCTALTCAALDDKAETITLSHRADAALFGEHKLEMRVGNEPPSNSIQFHVARCQAYTVTIATILIVAGLLVLAWLLVPSGNRTADETKKRKKYLLPAFLLDERTKSYSLSRFQFYLWTIVAGGSYIYLTLVRSNLQGTLALAEVPQNLPSILLIGAATGVGAAAVTNRRGSKGAGEEEPSLSDFICTGGIVAPDRFQYFIWTIIAVAGFLLMICLTDPYHLQALPTIPEGMVAISGISAAAYIGGKFAGVGPLVQKIVSKPWVKGSDLSLSITGEGIEKDSQLKLGDRDVTSYRKLPQSSQIPAAQRYVDEFSLEIPAKEVATLWPKLAPQQTIELRIENADKQYASKSVTLV